MKFTVNFNESERRALRLIAEGLSPMKSIFSFGENKNTAITTITSHDYEKDSYTIVVNIDEGYTKDILSTFAQYIPVVTSSALTIATGLRGMFIRLAEVEKPYLKDSNSEESAA